MTNVSEIIAEKKGYFTVEAALVLAVVFPVLFFLMSWIFLVYNRCQLEQDLEVLALRGSVYRGSKEELMKEMGRQEESLYVERFLFLERESPRIELKGSQICLKQVASMKIWGGRLFRLGEKRKIRADCINRRRNVTFFLRACRKVKQGKDKEI